MIKVICFVAGGTLGHINPALSMIKTLKNKQNHLRIIMILTDKERKYDFLSKNPYIDQIIYYKVDGFNRYNLGKNIKNICKIYQTFKGIKKLLKKEKITQVIGMGGYISAIAIKAAKQLHIKTIIHEQNVIMGLANKMVLKDVDSVWSAFPLDNCSSIVVGNPQMDEARSHQKNHTMDNHIVVISGTLGSKKINNVMVDFLQSPLSRSYYTTLITGKKYYEEVSAILGTQGKHYLIKPFDENLLKTLSTANLVISRSGATSIFEIIGLAVPSILIPSPNVTNNHQYYNALFLTNKEAAYLMEEKNLNIEHLNSVIKQKINSVIYIDNLNRLYKDIERTNWEELLSV